MSQNAEHDWVKQAKRGEPAAVAELHRQYWRAARAVAYGVTGDFALAEEASGAYLTAERSLLIEDEGGAVLTTGELLESKTTREAFDARMKEGSRLSDVLCLTWKQPEPLELRAIEELLHALSDEMVPGVAVRFLPRQEPRYRAALRRQLGDSPIPAAIGGVLNPWPDQPEGIHVAAVTIHLEPWASAHSGQAIGLAQDSPFPWYNRQASS